MMGIHSPVIKKYKSVILSYVIAVMMVVIMRILRPEFGSLANLRMLFIDASILGILATGLTLVIITGGIDLSLQWTLCVAAIVLTLVCKGNPGALVYVVPLILAGSAVTGLVNGYGVAYLELNPMIMTFGMNVILQGGLIGITQGAPGEFSPAVLHDLVLGDTLGLPNMFFIWLVVTIVMTLLLTQTPFGRRLFAIGTNETVAYYSGVNTRFTKMMGYCISSVGAALGGMLMVGRFGQSYLGMGDFVIFQAIAVVAVGGTSLAGGSGSYVGTVAGAIIMTVLTALLSAFNMPYSLQQVVYGAILLLAVIVSRSKIRQQI
jgi:ribose transport system permease protein